MYILTYIYNTSIYRIKQSVLLSYVFIVFFFNNNNNNNNSLSQTFVHTHKNKLYEIHTYNQ